MHGYGNGLRSPKYLDMEVYGPEFEHEVTFGPVAQRSLPSRLCADEEERRELVDGTGRYAALRAPAFMRNDELYGYLRLGVGSNPALALKAMGYPTPESLTEDQRTAGMLPDAIARPDREYPLDFIDDCEAEGISARRCEVALRRGITRHHVDGVLSPRELVFAFGEFVKKGGGALTSPSINPAGSAIDSICAGIVPLSALMGERGTVSTETVLRTVGALRDGDGPEFLDRLRADPELFGDFLRAMPGWRVTHEMVQLIRTTLERFGPGALALREPPLCLAPAGEDGHPAGLETALYTEQVMASRRTAHIDDWGCTPTGEIAVSDWRERGEPRPSATMADMAALRIAGIGPEVVAARVFDECRTPASVLRAEQDGIESALLDGVL